MFYKNVTRAGRQVLAAAVLPFAVVATLASAGTASATDYTAQQTRWADSLTATGNEQGVEFKTTTAPDLKSISTELNSGKFTLTADSSAVQVESATGAKVTEFPMSMKTAAGNTISLAPQISPDGKKLVVTPQVTKEVETELQPIAAGELKPIATNPDAQNHDPVANGLAAGALTGLGIAAILCIPAILVFVIGYFACIVASGISYVVFAAVIGAILGAVAPAVIPQVLP
ncbi:hypothetical protein [Nocardia brasiliensis]|uniref:DUF8020 domain-containing protein n=1 Tax=Nocardia brasiliensis (strain ATCC 700358 / HUJEG-1) TaxID=1133849 RepID=K0FCL9_NOCB7|nr:hypothetical protein [Nocardia brasiliensis]AFU05286.1 hypothetical protein O3I_036695 [Nocardia brasiliensis ATCC 700358]OCF87997.1 hypothetical protein AW168_23450 [Nocardia brasiliensis]